MNLRFESNEKQIELAKQEMERRLEGMNEFRAQLSNQAGTFLSRTEAQLQLEKLITRIVLLEKSVNFREGSRHWSDYIRTAGIAGAIVVISKLMHL
jgi:hypothetical protein